MNTEAALCPKEIAQLLNCSEKFVRSEIQSKNLAPAVRINRRVIWVRRSTVMDYLSRKTTKPAL